MPGIYSYDSPSKLFDKLCRDFWAFYKNPSEDGIFSVVFPLYHLREWICPGFVNNVQRQIEAKTEVERTPEERLYMALDCMKDYKTVGALCNHAKHFEPSRGPSLQGRTDQLHGAHAGLMHAGDSLGVAHFTVDGVEIRHVFWPVFQVYAEYFKSVPDRQQG